MTNAGKALLDAINRHQPEVWDDEERRNAIVAIEAEAIREWVDSEAVWDKLVDAHDGNPGWIVDALRALAEAK